MEIETKKQESELTLTLRGRLTTTTAPLLEEKVKNELNGINSLIFDCKDLEYISSAGLRVFLVAHKTMHGKGKFIVCNVNENIMEILDMTGFSQIIAIQ